MYITALKAISPQATYNEQLFEGETIAHSGNKYMALEPDYSGMIPASQLRRMGKSIRMGIGTGMSLLANETEVDGIIIGSSEGGLEDCIKFLNQIVNYDEGSLTPTNFVQSTPNALAGSLALMSKNTGYNITHVHKGLAFESALIDALLQINGGYAKKLLVGNVEEISEYNFNIETLAGQFKEEESTSENLLQSTTDGTVCGEGSAQFIVSAQANSYIAQITDADQISFANIEEVKAMIQRLLERNNLASTDIDTIILGYNGDGRTDHWYGNIQAQLFPTQTALSYKNLVGEYPSSSAFACYFATQILSGKNIPQSSILHNSNKAIRNIVIYNHYKGVQHGVILMKGK